VKKEVSFFSTGKSGTITSQVHGGERKGYRGRRNLQPSLNSRGKVHVAVEEKEGKVPCAIRGAGVIPHKKKKKRKKENFADVNSGKLFGKAGSLLVKKKKDLEKKEN